MGISYKPSFTLKKKLFSENVLLKLLLIIFYKVSTSIIGNSMPTLWMLKEQKTGSVFYDDRIWCSTPVAYK